MAMVRAAHNVWSRMSAHAPLKLALTVALSVGFCVPYFLLQHYPLLAPRAVPVTPLDRWIAFNPDWVWAYQSVYLLMPLPAWLVIERADLQRYVSGFIVMSVVGFAVFALYPVASPRPEAVPDHVGYQLLRAYDGTLNCLPSLHAGLAVFAALFGHAALAPTLSRRHALIYRLATTAWLAAILYATLATKQHWAVDLPAGILLAWAVHRWVWRRTLNETNTRENQDAETCAP